MNNKTDIQIAKEVPETKDWAVAKVIGKDGEYIIGVNLRTGLLRIRGLQGRLLTAEALMKPYGMDIPITELRMDWAADEHPDDFAFKTEATVGPVSSLTTLREDSPFARIKRLWRDWAYEVGLRNKPS